MKFVHLINKHEEVISKFSGEKILKKTTFKDYDCGMVKSIGAWGGDFILVTSKEEKNLEYFKRKGLNTLFLLDVIACVSPIGIFLGRIANFINGELYGKVTDHTFGIIFPRGGELPRHPSQLYEAFFEGLILFIILNCLFFFTNLKSKSGIISSLFLILYGIFRFFIETLREPDTHIGLLWNLLSMGQLLCVPMIASGIVLLVYVKKLNEQQIN